MYPLKGTSSRWQVSGSGCIFLRDFVLTVLVLWQCVEEQDSVESLSWAGTLLIMKNVCSFSARRPSTRLVRDRKDLQKMSQGFGEARSSGRRTPQSCDRRTDERGKGIVDGGTEGKIPSGVRILWRFLDYVLSGRRQLPLACSLGIYIYIQISVTPLGGNVYCE